MKRVAWLLAALAAVLMASPAQAAQFLYTITGTLIADELTFDELQLFGPSLGSAFTAKFVVDDTVPGATYSSGPNGSRASGGWLIAVGTQPPVSSSLTIGGITYDVRRGNQRQGPIIGPDGDPYGGEFSEGDAGVIDKNAALHRLELSGWYSRESLCCYPVVREYTATADALEFTLNSAAFTDADFRQLGTFTLQSSGGYFSSFNQYGPYPGLMTQIRMRADTLTVSALAAVPEIQTWLMMIAGIGVAGLALRRQARPVRSPSVGRRGVATDRRWRSPEVARGPWPLALRGSAA